MLRAINTVTITGVCVKKPIAERFWAKVNKGPHPKGCWEWTGPIDAYGYGRFYFSGRGHTEVKAHRISLQICGTKVEKGQVVMHSCDNRLCVNPSHLGLGTHADNARDMWAKGRAASIRDPQACVNVGEKNGSARLTESQVREILSLKGKERSLTLGIAYGVSQETILNIWGARAWKWVVA